MAIDSARVLDDHELLADARSGEPAAVQAVLAAVRPLAYGYSRSRLATYGGGVDVAEDVAQETCLAVLSLLPRYVPGGSPFVALVYAIAANKVADAQRRFHRAPTVLVDDLPERVEPSPTPEERAVSAASLRAADQLLARLPERMRRVLLLRVAGATAQRVADELGMTPNAVRVAQHRASLRLRELVEASQECRELFDEVA